MRVALDLLGVDCVRPVSSGGDLCYLLAGGAVESQSRIVRVHPEHKAWAEHGYTWPMHAGEHRDLRVRIASADVDANLSLTLRMIVAARTEGTEGRFFSALMLGSEIATQVHAMPQMAGMFAAISPLDDTLPNQDALIGDFTASITNISDEPSLSVVYSPTAQPFGKQDIPEGVISLQLSGNQADYRILLAMRAPADPLRPIIKELGE
jgi:hypothetical protein